VARVIFFGFAVFAVAAGSNFFGYSTAVRSAYALEDLHRFAKLPIDWFHELVVRAQWFICAPRSI
jgi:hypothetical protein